MKTFKFYQIIVIAIITLSLTSCIQDLESNTDLRKIAIEMKYKF